MPKPLKFLSPLYDQIKKHYEAQQDREMKEKYSDLVSVIGMVASEDEDSREALQYCLSGTRKDLVYWGHEYLRCLAG